MSSDFFLFNVFLFNKAEVKKLKHEMSTEDIYTLKFASNMPIEPFDVSAPKEHHSYLYNGGVNRPAFEIVSHADQRPATPVKYERANDLNRGPYNDAEFIYNHSFLHKTNSRRDRAHTSPIHLNYGNELSVHNTGKPVEWQVAGEIRTTDWDNLRRAYSKEDNTLHSFRYSGLEASNPPAKNSITPLNKMKSSSTELILSEQSKKTLYTSSDLLDSCSTSDAVKYNGLSKKNASHNSSNINYIYEIDNSNLTHNKTQRISSQLSSDVNEPSLHEDGRHEQQQQRGKQQAPRGHQDEHRHAASNRKTTFLNKLVRDPDTNEILSIKRINDTNNTTNIINVSNVEGEEENVLDRSNISVIDVTYSRSTGLFKSNSEQLEEMVSAPNLPPPLEFDNTEASGKSVINVKTNSVMSRNSSVKNGSEMEYDEEYFRTTNEIHMDLANELAAGGAAKDSYQNGQLLESFKLKKTSSSSSEENEKPKVGDLMSEIKYFNSSNLRATQSKENEQPLLYEKNIELLSQAPKLPSTPVPSTSSVASTARTARNKDDRSSMASSVNPNGDAALY